MLNGVRWFVGFGVMAATLAAAAPEGITFSSVVESGGVVEVSLFDPATQEREWVKVGGRFSGFEVRAYDAKRQVLTLGRGAQTWELALAAARILQVALTEEERAEIVMQVTNNMRQLEAAAAQFFLEEGVSETTFDRLVGAGPGRYIRQLTAVDGEDYTKLELKQVNEPTEWVIRTARGVEVRHKRH